MTSREKSIRIGAVTVAILVGGCAAALRPEGLGNGGEATIQVATDIRDGQFRTQGVVTPYSSADIDHVVLKLYTVMDSTETAVLDSSNVPLQANVASVSFSEEHTFKNLRGNTTYRVRAYAYASATESDETKRSKDSDSYVDVAVANDESPAMAKVPVQLTDKPFAGLATSSIAVTDGVLGASDPETITLPPLPDLVTAESGIALEPVGMSLNGTNLVFVDRREAGKAYRIDLNTRKVEDRTGAWATDATFPAAFPQQVWAFSPTEARVVVDIGVKWFRTVDFIFGGNAVTPTFSASSGDEPYGITGTYEHATTNATSSMWITYTDTKVIGREDRVGTSGFWSQLWAQITSATTLKGITGPDSDGALYIADAGANAILKMAANKAVSTHISTGLSGPTGIFWNGNSLFVADTGNNRILQYKCGTGDPVVIESALTAPEGVTADGVGNVYIADTGGKRVVHRRFKVPAC